MCPLFVHNQLNDLRRFVKKPLTNFRFNDCFCLKGGF